MEGLPLPSRIGRYDIAGRLAQGGMGEVLLGRLRGPHGFDRPVVIKRILPHLAARADIVDMFLTEARTIANVRHPNLVPIHELARDGGELFMVMEYLEGESVAGLCRRLAVKEQFLDYALAAHVIAEACAGLHAAHEAIGPDKRPLDIIHRDISPQNLFVSYAGAVHVIDFGIARTAAAVRHTEDGALRGKVEYFAPEQLGKGQSLDRRVDIFALGIVLFELASGHRLFRRDSAAEAMTSIIRDPTPSLRSIRPDAPLELDAICRRALEKSPQDRYQTAAEMRRALIAFARKEAGDVDLDEKLAQAMHALFADRANEKAKMLERSGTSASFALPLAEADATIDLPSAVDPLGPTTYGRASELTATAGAGTRSRLVSATTTSPAIAATMGVADEPARAGTTSATMLSAKVEPSARRGAAVFWTAMIVLAAALLVVVWKTRRPVATAAAPPSAVAVAASSAPPAPVLSSEPAPPIGVRPAPVVDAAAPSASSDVRPKTPRPAVRPPRPEPKIW